MRREDGHHLQLCSSSSHRSDYDYGMRAVKTVINAAGNPKRAEPDTDEHVLLLRALQDVNYPKFPEMIYCRGYHQRSSPADRARARLRRLLRGMKNEIAARNLQPCQFFLTKVIQLYEIVARHGLMAVGGPGGGKSSNIPVPKRRSGASRSAVSRAMYENVKIFNSTQSPSPWARCMAV